MGIAVIFSTFFSWQLMTVLLIVYAALAVADLFKRHLLSNAVVYWVTMLLAPFAALTSIVVPIGALFIKLNDENAGWGKVVLIFLGGAALFILAAVVYVRGHIAPINKASEKYGGNKRYFAAKRLITVGYGGTLLYALPFILMSCEMMSFLAVGTFVFVDILDSEGIFGVLVFAIMLLFVLLIPIVNIFAICALLFLGIEFAVWGITAAAVLLADILIANGCIRYIITTDKTKGKKALWIFLSLIPAVNLIYGIWCIRKINKSLKDSY